MRGTTKDRNACPPNARLTVQYIRIERDLLVGSG
jgi:hypothetical protein